jgi:hypothetical protein
MLPRIVLLAIAGMLALVPAWAHDHSNPANNEWLKQQRNQNGNLCCDGDDWTRADDLEWSAESGRYKVKVEGQWLDVPPEALTQAPNKMGHVLVWLRRLNGQPVVFCFAPGTLS